MQVKGSALVTQDPNAMMVPEHNTGGQNLAVCTPWNVETFNLCARKIHNTETSELDCIISMEDKM
jgi:hypothetical protein